MTEPTGTNSISDQECAEFQASMADRIGNGEDLQSHPHMRTCDRCSALLSDLEALASAIRELMPTDAEPREDLWSKIESKLALESTLPEGDQGSHPESGTDPLTVNLDRLAIEGGVA